MESFSLFPHASASGENEGCKCAFLHFQDPAVICSFLFSLVFLKHFVNGPTVAFIPVMKDSNVEKRLVHGVPDPPCRDVQPCIWSGVSRLEFEGFSCKR